METEPSKCKTINLNNHSKSRLCLHSKVLKSKKESGKEMFEAKKTRKETEERLVHMQNKVNRLKREVTSSSRTQQISKQKTERILKTKEWFYGFKQEVNDQHELIKEQQQKTTDHVSTSRLTRRNNIELARARVLEKKQKIAQEAKSAKDELSKYLKTSLSEAKEARKAKAQAQSKRNREKAHKRIYSDAFYLESLSKGFNDKLEEEYTSKICTENMLKQLEIEEQLLKEVVKNISLN